MNLLNIWLANEKFVARLSRSERQANRTLSKRTDQLAQGCTLLAQDCVLCLVRRRTTKSGGHLKCAEAAAFCQTGVKGQRPCFW